MKKKPHKQLNSTPGWTARCEAAKHKRKEARKIYKRNPTQLNKIELNKVTAQMKKNHHQRKKHCMDKPYKFQIQLQYPSKRSMEELPQNN